MPFLGIFRLEYKSKQPLYYFAYLILFNILVVSSFVFIGCFCDRNVSFGLGENITGSSVITFFLNFPAYLVQT